jgi:hypothetical protein
MVYGLGGSYIMMGIGGIRKGEEERGIVRIRADGADEIGKR